MAENEPGAAQRKKTSTVWKYFTREAGNFTRCTICKAMIKYHNNTSSMLNHLKIHPLPTPSRVASDEAGNASEDTGQQRQTSLGEYAKRKLTQTRRRDITRLLVNVIVKDTRPLALVSGIGFKEMLHFFLTRLRYPLTCYTVEKHKPPV